MSTEQKHDWDPLDAAVLEDQRHAYDEMRQRCPVAHSDAMGWSLFRHDDIAGVLADPETYSNVSRFLAIPNGMDAPEHGPYRDALEPNFDSHRLPAIEQNARDIATALIAPLVARGEVEFVEDFADPFALRTLCAWVGWRDEQWVELAQWLRKNSQAALDRDAVAGKALADSFTETVCSDLARRRDASNANADAIDQLMRTEVDGVRLEDAQIVSVLRNWTAGHGTVAAGLSVVVALLAEDEALQERLRLDPARIPGAVEELLRVDGPLVANPRTTTRDVQIGGRTIPEGARLSLMWIAANRDPDVFKESYDVDVERDTGQSLVWGRGIHVCQGAALARLELRVAIEVLLSSTKRFRRNEDGVARRASSSSNGFTALPLVLG